MNKKNSLFEFDDSYRHSEAPCPPSAGRSEESLKKRCFANAQHDVILIGTDEAGRGPGAGGVFASAVYFPEITKKLIEKLSCLNDSKQLSKKKREELYDIIMENSINSTVCVEVEEIEKINILNASLKAMKLACENVINAKCKEQSAKCRVGLLSPQNILVLVDGNKLIKDFSSLPSPLAGEGRVRGKLSQLCIIKGDSKSASIAAASILAKVTRDRYMQSLHEKFPQYNWAQNAGYLTKEHLSAIDRYGITPHHRKSFLRKHEESKCINQLSLYQK